MSESNNTSVYREVLLDHFHNPRGKGELGNSEVISRGSNPRCGDEIEIGLSAQGNGTIQIRFRGRGCSICLASASIMVESCTGLLPSELIIQHKQVTDWLTHKSDFVPAFESIKALDAVRSHSARKRCVLLAWQALAESIDKHSGRAGSHSSF